MFLFFLVNVTVYLQFQFDWICNQLKGKLLRILVRNILDQIIWSGKPHYTQGGTLLHPDKRELKKGLLLPVGLCSPTLLLLSLLLYSFHKIRVWLPQVYKLTKDQLLSMNPSDLQHDTWPSGLINNQTVSYFTVRHSLLDYLHHFV